MKQILRFLGLVVLFLVFSNIVVSQGVAINSDGSNADNSAMLDVSSNNKGMLVPRVSIADLNTAAPISAPAVSLLLYNTNVSTGVGYYYWDGSKWTRLTIADDLDYVDGNGVATRIAFWSDANTLTSDANLYWDDTNERLGVGTSNPTAKAHITAPTSGSTLKLGRLGGQPTIEGTDSWMMIEQSGTNPLALNYYGSNHVVMVNGGGNVGIGTTSPSSKLHVNGTVRFQNLGTGTQTTGLMIDASGNISGRTLNIANWDDAFSWGDHAAAGYLTSFSEVDPSWDGNPNTTDPIGRDGHVGIGTSSPAFKLDVRNGAHVSTNSNADPFIVSRNYKTTNHEELRLGVNDTDINFHYINDESSSRMSFRLQNTDTEAGGGVNASDHTVMTLSANSTEANVGIGTTSPTAQLHTTGTIRFQGLATSTQTTSLMIDANGNVTNRTLNIANWDAAYAWGNHALAGYLTGERYLPDDPATSNVNMNDFEVQKVKALQGIDWDDNTGGTDNKYRLLWRDGAHQFYNGGVVVGSYGNGTWSDLTDGRLIVEERLGIGTTSPTESIDVTGNAKVSGDYYLNSGHYIGIKGDNNIIIDDANPTWQGNNYGAEIEFRGDNVLNQSKLNAGGLELERDIEVSGRYFDSNSDAGTAGQVLSSTTTGTQWAKAQIVQSNAASVTAGNWYRIASNSGNRADASFTLRDQISGGGHSTMRFHAGINYGNASGISFNLISHSRYGSATFTKVRIIRNGTYDGAYLEIYCNRSGSVEYDIHDNFQSSGWTPEDWTAGSVPAGWTAHEYETDRVLAVGNSNDLLSLTRGGNLGINRTDPAQKLDVLGRVRSSDPSYSTSRWIDIYSNAAQVIETTNDLYIGTTGSSAIHLQPGRLGSSNSFVHIRNNSGTNWASFDGANERFGVGTNNPAHKLHVVDDGTYTIYGNNTSESDRHGVYGICNNRAYYGFGVKGEGGYMGVRGNASMSGTGVRYGVYGYAYNSDASGSTSYGVYGSGYSSGGDAYGVYASGNFTCTGTKSATVKTEEGPKELYCQESPENWFEDFGSSEIYDGQAIVNIKQDYIATVTINSQHPMKVFITPNGNMGNWWVEKKNNHFIVYASEAEDGTKFDFRVVAKRKGYEDVRLKDAPGAYTDKFLYPKVDEVPAEHKDAWIKENKNKSDQ